MKKLATIAGLLGTAVASHANIWEVDFLAGLSGANEVPAVTTTAEGGEIGDGFRYDDVLNKLDINFGYGVFGWTPLEGNFSGVHIHQGSVTESGPIVFNLQSFHLALGPKGGVVTGSVTLTDAQEAVLFAGNYYVNIHSTKFPSGELRGQLSVVPEPGTWALMGGGLAALLWFRRK